MPYAFDFKDGDVLAWSLTDDGATAERIADYAPSLYVDPRGMPIPEVRAHVAELPAVRGTGTESWRSGFRHDAAPVLRVDVDSIETVRAVARTVGNWGSAGEYRLYNVDFPREFRYYLENGLTPVPDRSLRSRSDATPVRRR